jgi:hypothetical protein
MESHFLHMTLYSTIVATFMALLIRNGRRERFKLGASLWLAMVGGALLLAYLMYPVPR